MSRAVGFEHAPTLKRGRAVKLLALALASGAVLVAPFAVPTYFITLMLPFFAYGVTLLGLNLLFGYTGLLSFGQALFLGVGAYTAAFCTSRFGIRHMEVILLLAALASVLLAIPVGAVCVRYVKIYFGLLTLAFGMLFYSFVLKFYSITGGDQGIRVLQPYLLGMQWPAGDLVGFLSGPYYYYSATLLVLLGALMWRIVHSPFGLCLEAIRENPVKAEYLGISVKRFRWYAFVIAAVYGGVGGAMIAPITGNVDPTIAYWTQSGNLVFMTLLGGFASFFGPLLGAFLFIFLQDRIMAVVPYWRLMFGAILALVVSSPLQAWPVCWHPGALRNSRFRSWELPSLSPETSVEDWEWMASAITSRKALGSSRGRLFSLPIASPPATTTRPRSPSTSSRHGSQRWAGTRTPEEPTLRGVSWILAHRSSCSTSSCPTRTTQHGTNT